jgi:tetratricopeptide (TPR) repeat protein
MEAAALSSIGSVMNTKGEYLKAAGLFERAAALAEETGDLVSMAGYLSNASAAHMQLGNKAKGMQFSSRAYTIAKEVGHVVLLRDAAMNHYETLKSSGRYGEALEAYELHVRMRDSVMREENQREAIRLEFMKDAELRESEIALLHSENERKEAETLAERRRRQMTMLGSGGVILLLAGGGTWFVSLRRAAHRRELERQEYRRKVIENDFLRSKLKTHFVKNAMQSIDGFVQSGRSDLASAYIERFNTLMRWILDTAGQDTVTLTEELEAMRLYLTLEEPAARDGLQWSVTVADDVDAEEVQLPPLILQPFVENALFHGLKDIGRAGEVRISVSREDGHLVCSVEDNGRGIGPDAEGKAESNGLKLVRERLALFSGMARTGAGMSVRPTGVGTRAEIRLAA